MLEKDLIERKSAIWKAALIGFVEKRSLEGAAAIHVTSGREADEAAAFGFSLRRVSEIPNGVDLDRAAVTRVAGSVTRDRSADPTCCSSAASTGRKGLDRLIESMSHAPGLRVVIAGNDEEGYTSGARVARGSVAALRDRVIFAGPVHGADKAALIARRARAGLAVLFRELWQRRPRGDGRRPARRRVARKLASADLVRSNGCGVVIDGGAEQLGRAIAHLAADLNAG